MKSFNTASSELVKLASRTAHGKHLFLSHFTEDEEFLDGAIGFFLNFHASPYVAEYDEQLPSAGSPEVASLLRGAIEICPKLVVLVSPNSHRSGWIPWELGLADGMKGTTSVAALPVGPESNFPLWATREYLGMYPRIVHGSVAGRLEWWVHDPRKNTYWVLADWLHTPNRK